jgi:hypothetical protein
MYYNAQDNRRFGFATQLAREAFNLKGAMNVSVRAKEGRT